MASLKDLRNRIASTKATQKITKAMQMVAASKLRRAQTAALAARPYAEHMDKVLGNIASAVSDLDSRTAAARRHRPRSGPPARRVHGRARPVRPVQFGDRAARARTRQAADERGQGGQDPLRRPQGLRAAPAPVREADHRVRSSCARVRTLGFEHAADDRRKDHRAVRAGRVRRLHPVLLALQVGDRADPDRAADHSADASRRTRQNGARGLRVRAGRARHSDRAAAAQHRGAGVPRAAGKRRVVLRRADERDGQRHPQCRRHDPQADPQATTARARR